jgi:hypothetical protein
MSYESYLESEADDFDDDPILRLKIIFELNFYRVKIGYASLIYQ